MPNEKRDANIKPIVARSECVWEDALARGLVS